MKRYITRDYFLNDYGYSADRSKNTTDEQITYAIQKASTRIDTLTGGAISEGIDTGLYSNSDGGTLSITPGKILDPVLLKKAERALEAVREQTSALTKFALDTGWDFLSGSFSSSLGSQSQSETIDFEASVEMIEKTVREALAVYDFTTSFYTEDIEIGFEDAEDEREWKDAENRPLTERSLVARLTGGFLQGANGIKIAETVPGEPSKGITITFDNEKFTLKNYPDKNDFQTKASDGAIGTYEKDGHPVFLIKFAGVAYEYLSLDALALDAYTKAETDAKLAGKADAGVSYTKVETDARYQRLSTTFTPTTTHQTGFIIADETGIKDLPIGEYIKLDLTKIDDMISNPANVPAAGDQTFIGDASIRIINSAGSAALKWETKTNATDTNVKDNYKTKDFILVKKSQSEYDFVRLENKQAKPHWETIDHLTYTFTKPVKIRMTNTGGVSIGYISIGNNKAFFQAIVAITVNSLRKSIADIIWESKTPKLASMQTNYIFATKTTEVKYYEDVYDVLKVEIWVE